ncbi:protein-methionine-sulfoxide reductase heme-binding subunit MsrQ [Wenxinia saemankumensis]|uniref:Protein-methionine-sulfoxide reductase heme-binding subunit MsrQ n=1 Tax=Wenxinia saemankumensis TaxID=1447782 RepID=A0A1M6FFQ1_9RHOB|nr:protein-methionine-sulfoxide reductase heme-binding subunit MsrQ [Wenxinia saemankumensis]SHI96551.1 sulfoxide reductase heme-binding subunit YedZ [Wenxinia saemankumensis]
MLADRLNAAARRVPTWPVYGIGMAVAGWYFWLGLTGGLGPEPINTLERLYGEKALQLLVVGLALTPLRRFAGVNLIRFRRAVGLTAFFFVLAHFSVWALLDVQRVAAIWADLVKRPYITVGFAALLMLLPLALTSNNRSIRALGARWRQLHKLTYPAAILAALHYVWLAKGFQIEPLLYMAAILALLALRVRLPKGASRPSRA